MGKFDPAQYIAIYCIVVFGIPFLIQASLAVRLMVRLFKIGIDPLSIDWFFRQEEMFDDPGVAKLYEKAMGFFPILLFTWILGVVILLIVISKFGGSG